LCVGANGLDLRLRGHLVKEEEKLERARSVFDGFAAGVEVG
jgi:hypothetical protein